MTDVIVLGCGPSGLAAAYAAETMGGCNVSILSRPQKSNIYGAQFLHAPIPGVLGTEAHTFVKWEHQRDAVNNYDPALYLRKVYGQAWDGSVSSEMFCAGKFAWDLREAYDRLWNSLGHRVVTWESSEAALDQLEMRADVVVINTLPRKLLCVRPDLHTFVSTKIWAMGDAPAEGRVCPVPCKDNTVVYNGNANPSWYRLSRIYGHTTVEWPGSMDKPPLPGVAAVQKPVSTNCDCRPGIIKVGRFGMWRRGVLLHQVYGDTLVALSRYREGFVA